MVVGKNHVPHKRAILVRLTEEDFQTLRKEAKKQKIGIGPLVRMLAFQRLRDLNE